MTFAGVTKIILHDLHFLRARMALFVFNIVPDFYSLNIIRNLLLRLGGARVPLSQAYIRSPLYCSDLRGIIISNGVFINSGCRFQGTVTIQIGANCQIGPQCCFETTDHLASGKTLDRPIYIGNKSWLGAKVVVVGGVSIGDCVTIGAGAVVTKDVPAGEVWGGVPARSICKDAGKLPL